MKSSLRKAIIVAICLLSPSLLRSQAETPTAVTTQNRTGELPFSPTIGTSAEHVDLATGALNIHIPLWSTNARHSTDSLSLRWNSNLYYRATRTDNLGHVYYVWTIPKHSGWQLNQPYWTSTPLIVQCYNPRNLHPNPTTLWTTSYIFTDSSGTQYNVPIQKANNQNCNSPDSTSNPDLGAAGAYATLSGLSLVRADGATISSPSHTLIDQNGNYFDHGGVYDLNGGWTASANASGTDNLGQTTYSLSHTAQNGIPAQTLVAVTDSNGHPQTITINWEPITLSSDWVNGQWYAIQSIVLPNTQSYQFQYDGYGEIKEIDLPEGGVITYTWGTYSSLEGLDFESRRYVTSRTETVNGVASTWNIVFGNVQGSSNQEAVVTYPAIASGTGSVRNQSIYYSRYGAVVDAQIYSGTATGTPLREYLITYATDGYRFHDSCNGNIPPDQSQYVRPTRIITVLDDGSATKKELSYESPVAFTYYPNHCDTQAASSVPVTGYASRGNVTLISEYGWGTPVGSVGAYTDVTAPLIRTTTNTYLHAQSGKGAYLTANIVDKIWSQTIQDSASNTVATTNYRYDTTAISSTAGAANHDYTNYPYTNTVRGNATQVQKWLNTNNSYLTTTYTYDDLGNIVAIKDAKGISRNYSYLDSFADSACLPSGGAGDAYVTQYTDPAGHITKIKYFSCSGLKQQHQDQNDINSARNGTTFTYDLMNRPVLTFFPDGGSTQLSYVDTANAVSITTTKALDPVPPASPTRFVVSNTLFDGLGRAIETQLQEDGTCVIYTDTVYDALGHVASVSNPYRHSCVSDNLYYTKYQYDALGRKILEVPQDATLTSNTVQTSYAGAATTVTDQTGRTHEAVSDALGRLVQVFENPSQGTFNGVAYPKFETDYFYDVLGDLFCVQQKGDAGNSTTCPTLPGPTNPFTSQNDYRGRWFVYDSLSRLTDSYNPETGHTNWTYDANGNVLVKTDNKGQTITYAYNNENRVTGKTYSAGDHGVTYFFNQTSYNGLTIANGIDRRTGMSDASGTTAWSFDAMGREVAETRKIGSVTKTNNTTYNLMGLPTALTYPNGTAINYVYDTAGRVLTVTDGSRSNVKYVWASTYVSACQVPAAAGVAYTPFGAPTLYEVGYDPNNQTTAGANVALCYNKRLQPSSIIAKAANTTLPVIESLTPGFGIGNGDNGDLLAITNNVDTTLSKNFFYDAFNRITEYKSVSPSQRWDVKYTIDAWGNLSKKQPQPNYGGESLLTTATTANQLIGYGYDLNGNMNFGDGHNYSYDSENRIASIADLSESYTYDGDGERVEKSASGTPTKIYWGGGAGHALVESDGLGNPTSEYVYFGGKIVARRDLPSGTLRYYFDDHLGTSTVLSDAQGNKIVTYDYAPYGELHYQVGSDPNVYLFTGKERDAETGNDYFGARYYQSAMARFMTPDWAATPSPLPYASTASPQTINLYSYVANNPTTGIDPDGHQAGVLPWPVYVAPPGTGGSNQLTKEQANYIGGKITDFGQKLGEVLKFDGNLLLNFLKGGGGSSTPYVGPIQNRSDGSSSSAQPTPPNDQKPTDRGRENEKKTLAEEGLEKNTKTLTANDPKTGKEGKTIPDVNTDKVIGDVKDTKVVSNTEQIRLQKQAAQDANKEYRIYTGTDTHVTDNAADGATIVKKDYLGPQ